MVKVTLSEAVGLTGVSESTIRRDIKSGKVSATKDEKGHRLALRIRAPGGVFSRRCSVAV